MKKRNVRNKQWERMITRLIKHPSRDSLIVTRGYDRHVNRMINRWAKRNVR